MCSRDPSRDRISASRGNLSLRRLESTLEPWLPAYEEKAYVRNLWDRKLRSD